MVPYCLALQLDETKLPEEEQEYIRQLRKRYNIEDLVIRDGVIPKRSTEDTKGEELQASKAEVSNGGFQCSLPYIVILL